MRDAAAGARRQGGGQHLWARHGATSSAAQPQLLGAVRCLQQVAPPPCQHRARSGWAGLVRSAEAAPAALSFLRRSVARNVAVLCINLEHMRRHCEQNPEAAYAQCSVPQELTNEEIDQELGSDVRSCHALPSSAAPVSLDYWGRNGRVLPQQLPTDSTRLCACFRRRAAMQGGRTRTGASRPCGSSSMTTSTRTARPRSRTRTTL